MIKFGIDAIDVDSAALAIGRVLDVELRPHESDWCGGPYWRAEVPEGKLLLQGNMDLLDDNPFEVSWPTDKLVLYLDGPNHDAWQPYTRTLCSLPDPKTKRLDAEGSLVNGLSAKSDDMDMRPKAVTISTWLMAILNILGYAILWEPAAHKTRFAVFFFITIFTLTIAAGYVVLWFYWKGKNWARILVLLNCFLCFYNVHDLHFVLRVNPVEKVMLMGEAVLAVFLLYWLNTQEAKAYFKRGEFRTKVIAAD